VKIVVLRDVTPFKVLNICGFLEESAAHVFVFTVGRNVYPDDGEALNN
jgi:hypothetical protein